ncbi:extensin-like [Penaeus monodon]|uniref:extensin-like n=1 Tax=Penaeus monodon TaxID=6687 RepID=UPI0018A77B03|nr:extensin-like [Penaeus monodon]
MASTTSPTAGLHQAQQRDMASYSNLPFSLSLPLFPPLTLDDPRNHEKVVQKSAAHFLNLLHYTPAQLPISSPSPFGVFPTRPFLCTPTPSRAIPSPLPRNPSQVHIPQHIPARLKSTYPSISYSIPRSHIPAYPTPSRVHIPQPFPSPHTSAYPTPSRVHIPQPFPSPHTSAYPSPSQVHIPHHILKSPSTSSYPNPSQDPPPSLSIRCPSDPPLQPTPAYPRLAHLSPQIFPHIPPQVTSPQGIAQSPHPKGTPSHLTPNIYTPAHPKLLHLNPYQVPPTPRIP